MVSAGPWALRAAICAALFATLPICASVRLRVHDGRPFADDVFVNGHGPYRFLIDTGTSMNLIEPALARKIGMQATFRDEVSSAIGTELMPGSEGNIVQLGTARADRQRFQFSKLTALHMLDPDAEGVLGQSFLAGFDYKLDLRAKVLEFGKQESSGSRAKVRMLDGRSSITTSLGDLVLDSGAARLVLFGVRPDFGQTSDMRTIAGSKTVGMIDSKLVIDGVKIWRGDAVAIPDRREEGVSGLVPVSLFKSIYFCNSEGYIVFE